MKRLMLAMCGAAALGLTMASAPASAGPLKPANPLSGVANVNGAEEVRWRRVCRPVWNGPVRVVNCRNVWVGPQRGPGPGYYGQGPRGPRYGYYGPGPRPGPGPGPRYF